MTADRNIAQEARRRAEHAQLMRRWQRPAELPEQIMSPLFPLSRSVPTSQQWPLDDAERDLPTSTESDLADANVLARQALAAPELDDTDRRILRAIIEGDSHMTVVEIAAEADISRATLYRRLEALEVVLADLLGR